MKNFWISKSDGDSAVIFIHGFVSSGDGCWRYNENCYWPEFLEQEKINLLSIFVYEYKTNFFSGSYSLDDVVDDLKENLKVEGLLKKKNLIFVCHSMGGIIARRFVVERAIDLIENKIKIGLFLIASPSLGSNYANWLKPIAKVLGHSQADALYFSQKNNWLNGLDKTFINLKESNRLTIIGKELVEDTFVVSKKFFFLKQIVPPFSGARYFGEQIKIANSNHFTIAKPISSDTLQHRILVDFIKSIIDNKNNSSITKADFLKADSLLDDAWDKIAGNKFSTGVTELNNNRADLEAARRMIDKASVLAKNYDKVYRTKGLYFQALKEYSHAEEQFKKAIDLSPQKGEGYYHLALLLAKTNNITDAIANIKIAIENNSEEPSVFYSLPYIYLQAGDKDKAKPLLEECIRRFPQFSLAHFTLAKIYYEEEEIDLAIDYLQKTITINNTHEQALLLLGHLLIKNKSPRKAIHILNDAIKINPKNPRTWQLRGIAFSKIGEPELAEIDLYKSKQLN